jgi:mobilome CxxCx(11)CxxC protein
MEETTEVLKSGKTSTASTRNNDLAEARERAIFCFGTARLFEKRRKSLRFVNKINKYIGLFIPLSLGYFFISSGTESESLMPIFIYTTAFFSTAQLLISLWALISDWDIKLENYTESVSNNARYYRIFKEIEERYDEDPAKYSAKLKEIMLLDDAQRDKDDRQNISASEDRFIMRRGLYQFQQKCSICGKIPDIRKPKKCANCGK